MSDDRFPAPGAAALAADGSLLLGARRIPLPASVSPQARAFLAMRGHASASVPAGGQGPAAALGHY
ncbi:MAG: hypothetical protein IPM40_12935 [Gammaproteobacteria bacterium]|nr:hypothetical protein [Gammaproteobacteria bacterium]